MDGLIVKDIDFDCGIYEATESIATNTDKEYTISFNRIFSTSPVVVANVLGSFYPTTEVSPCNIKSISTTSFKVLVHNSFAYALTPKITWMASL